MTAFAAVMASTTLTGMTLEHLVGSPPRGDGHAAAGLLRLSAIPFATLDPHQWSPLQGVGAAACGTAGRTLARGCPPLLRSRKARRSLPLEDAGTRRQRPSSIFSAGC